MIHAGDFVSIGDPNQLYRVSNRTGNVVTLRLVNGHGGVTIKNADVVECKLEYRDPRVKAVQHV